MQILIETITNIYILEKTENRDISEKVVIETIKTKEKNKRRALPYFTSRYTGPAAQH